MRETPEETFVVIGVEVISGLTETFEAPPTTLAREGFILALAKKVWHNLTNEEVLVMDLPCPTIRLQTKKRTRR